MKLDTKELKSISILYVEDDDLVREQTFNLFDKLFKNVFVAIDGQDGLEKFNLHKDDIDIIVTDINMPILNGFEMIKEIYNTIKTIPIIVTTAHTDSKNLINAIDLNVDKYVSKPIQIRDLTVALVELVVKYRRSKNIESLARDLAVKSNKDDKTTKILKTELEIQTGKVKYYETIIDNFLFTFKTDKMGKIEDVSTKFLHFFSYSKDEIIEKNISELRCDTCEDESFQKLMLKAIHTKKTITSTQTFVTNENTKVNFDVTMTPTYDNTGLVCGYTFYLDLVLT